jgi:beta-aspartyl-peptidase (threonine type)
MKSLFKITMICGLPIAAGLLILVVWLSCTSVEVQSSSPVFGLAIHGGAGTILRKNMTAEKEEAYRAKLKEALQAGYEILQNGGSSLDAVEKTIRILEDSPLFNAGKGAVFTNAETNELDAAIMDGNTLNAGAVAAVKHIKNPISAARLVMEKSPHVMMIGDGAETFVRQFAIEFVDPAYFYTEQRWQQLQEKKKEEAEKGQPISSLDHEKLKNEAQKQNSFGTVGAVALDKQGNLAAGTSTGGMSNKRWGRVGDSPVIGAGTYADNNTCAVSATGHGEYFMRLAVAHDISAMMAYTGASLPEAANHVVLKKLTELGGSGGVIAIDKQGVIVSPFNTEGMYRGYVNKAGEMVIEIYKEENSR